MPVTLGAARAAARQGRWHAVLGLQPGASADEIRKARRLEQRTAHTDKGGSTELSQLINQAADKLLERRPAVWVQAREGDSEWLQEFFKEVNEELEQRRRKLQEEKRQKRERAARQREEKQREEAEEQRRWEEERRRRWEDAERRGLERQRLQRAHAHEETVRRVGHRRTRCKGPAYLGELAGKAFPVIKHRINKLQQAGKRREAQALAYAVEAEMTARRVARETRFPKTEGLAKRDAQKAARLDELRVLYQKAYDRLRYVRRAWQPEDFARLCVQRLLDQAWGALLDMPAPLVGEDEAIAMADWQDFLP
jgi:curved DNA-binding protein CbpA